MCWWVNKDRGSYFGAGRAFGRAGRASAAAPAERSTAQDQARPQREVLPCSESPSTQVSGAPDHLCRGSWRLLPSGGCHGGAFHIGAVPHKTASWNYGTLLQASVGSAVAQ